MSKRYHGYLQNHYSKADYLHPSMNHTDEVRLASVEYELSKVHVQLRRLAFNLGIADSDNHQGMSISQQVLQLTGLMRDLDRKIHGS